jgi:hypothetical protein
MLWRLGRALVLTRRGETIEAERLLREAATIGTPTDIIWELAHVHFALARLLRDTGREAEAATAGRRSLELYREKGVEPMVTRLEAFLGERDAV